MAPSVTLTGRSFYTALGHLNSTWQNETFIEHVLAGVTYAMGANTTKAFNSQAQVGNPQTSSPTNSSSSEGASLTSTGTSASTGSVAPSHKTGKSERGQALGGSSALFAALGALVALVALVVP